MARNVKDIDLEFTPEEWILAILFADRDRPVRGKLMLMKMAFILAKEIVPQADELLAFYPKDYGPFSRYVAIAVERLAEASLIQARGASTEKHTDRTDFRLTEEGLAKGEVVFGMLSAEVQGRLRDLREGAEEMGYSGIVRYVYAKYPEYITASKIRKEMEIDY